MSVQRLRHSAACHTEEARVTFVMLIKKLIYLCRVQHRAELCCATGPGIVTVVVHQLQSTLNLLFVPDRIASA